MSEEEPRNALDEAMAEALESVEQREREAMGDSADADGDAVEVETGKDEAAAESAAEDDGNTESHAELQDQLLRLAADFDNYRKRTRREMEDARKFGIESLLRDVLPVLDNFERALAAAEEDDSHPLVSGIRMVMKQFRDVLDHYGVRGFDSLGEVFDPEKHEALSQMPSAEHEAGTILNEHERGYMIHERLLRPARVVVAMPPPEAIDEAEAEEAEGEEA